MSLEQEMKLMADAYDAQVTKQKADLLEKIERTKKRMEAKDTAIEELKYERDLIFNNLCNIISEELRLSPFNIFMGFTSDIFWKAWRWANHKDTVDKELEEKTLTKDEYKSHKTAFDVTTRIVKEKFFGELKDKVKFKELIMSWTTGYDFTYTYKDQEIIIFIPVFHADEKDWIYALNGYCVRYKASEHCQDWICGGLEYKEVAEKLQKWILEEGWKKKDE